MSGLEPLLAVLPAVEGAGAATAAAAPALASGVSIAPGVLAGSEMLGTGLATAPAFSIAPGALAGSEMLGAGLSAGAALPAWGAGASIAPSMLAASPVFGAGGASMAEPGFIANLIAQMQKPENVLGGLSGGLKLINAERQLAIQSKAASRAPSSPPYMHPGAATPVKIGMPLARKTSPLEEFAALLRRQ